MKLIDLIMPGKFKCR